MGDELVSGKKISWVDISTGLDLLEPLKSRHPGLFVWQNEGGTGWEAHLPNGKLPKQVDVISIDDYSKNASAMAAWYSTTLYSVLMPTQVNYMRVFSRLTLPTDDRLVYLSVCSLYRDRSGLESTHT